ncbi:MAG: nucleotidyltransferase family protein, partial [Dehalococcoidia bacterium]
EYDLVHAAWREHGIPSMFIKTACIPPSFPYASDNLDVMVPEECHEEAKAILKRLGFFEDRPGEEPKKFLFHKLVNGRDVCVIHLHHFVGWNINFFEEQVLWQRARVAPDDDAVLAPSPEDALLINLAHAFYENKRFALYDLEKMRTNWTHHSLDWEYLPEVPKRSGWYDGFLLGMLLASHLEEALTGQTRVPVQNLRQWNSELRRYPLAYRYYRHLVTKPIQMPFKVSFVFSKVLYYQKILRDIHDPYMARLRNFVFTLVWGFKLKSGIRPQPATLVSVSGIDGSGKTQLAHAVTDILQSMEIRASCYWNRIGCSPWTRIATRTSRLLSPQGNPGPPATSRRLGDLESRSSLVKALWVWTNVLELALRYTFRVRLPLLLGKLGPGKVVICDRYVLDAQAEVLARLPHAGRIARVALALLRFASPRPDLTYVLDVPELVAQRRHTLPLSEDVLREQRRLYQDLGAGANARVVDGTRTSDEVIHEVAMEVIARFMENYPTWVNGLLLSNPSQRNPNMKRP